MNIDAIIRAVQSKLELPIDGQAGPQTWQAILKTIAPHAGLSEADLNAPADARSETNIATLLPQVRPYARALIDRARSQNIDIKIIASLRTFAEQDALYAQGRTAPGGIVTNAKGGESNHNYGIAFDVGVFDGTAYFGESPKYAAVGALGVALGLEWGGNWRSIVDQPHFQLRPQWASEMSDLQMMNALLARHHAGKPVFS